VAAVGPVVIAVASVRAVITVGAAVVEDEVAASLLDHRELIEPLRQPLDPEGEALHAPVLVQFMMRLDVEGRANVFKLFEGA
jgi:hypothetical protein